MTIADIQKIAAEAVANALRLTQTKDAPAPVQTKASADLKAKRLASLEKARAAKKAKAQAKPASVQVIEEPVQKAKKAKPAWSVKDHVTKKGQAGQVVTVGPFSAWIPAGDKARRDEVFQAINGVFRTDEVRKLAAAIR